MTKAELIKTASVICDHEISQKDLSLALSTFVEAITRGLCEDGTVSIPNLGAFESTYIPEQELNAFGKIVVSKAHSKIKFRPFTALREAANEAVLIAAAEAED